jgi:hypothetical protein
MKDMRAKFDMSILISIVIGIVIVAILSVVGLQILSETKADFTENGTEWNATQSGIEGIAKIPAKLPLLATAAVGVVIIVMILGYFGGMTRGR